MYDYSIKMVDLLKKYFFSANKRLVFIYTHCINL
jgi:hypothetical protein